MLYSSHFVPLRGQRRHLAPIIHQFFLGSKTKSRFLIIFLYFLVLTKFEQKNAIFLLS